jgi:uncharacterized repeat protein (TIGR03803 family)
MTKLAQHSTLDLRSMLRVAFVLALVFAQTVVAMLSAQAQTFHVIHNFTGGSDGGEPFAGVTIDAGGNLYGAASGGADGAGVIFKMTHKSSWIFTPLYIFGSSGNDGGVPYGGVVRDASGVLYGTTVIGGSYGGGTVFKLQPSPSRPPSVLAPWMENILYSFQYGSSDGFFPEGNLVFDRAKNLYGTTYEGGTGGVVFKLTPSNGGWTESILYNFTGGSDGGVPHAGVVFDSAGNLYGTTELGGAYNCGTVYELTPAGSGWTESVLYSFMGNGDGCRPWAGLVFDQAGNLYGATPMTNTDSSSNGVVFELSPSGGGQWNYSLLYTFTSGYIKLCSEGHGTGPTGTLTMDSSGVLYGTTQGGGFYEAGNVFKLTPSHGGWAYTSLHDFNNNYPASDGLGVCAGVTLDANGNLYGTVFSGAGTGNGDVWEITP